MRIRLFVFCVLSVLSLNAQNLLEIGIAGSSNQVRIVNLKQNGLILLDKSSSGLLKIKKIDRDLNVLWDVDTDLSSKMNFLDEFYDGKFLYILLEQKNSINYQLLKISTSFAAVQRFEIRTVSGFNFGQFVASDRGICVGGAVKNEPFLIFIENENTTPKYYSSNLKGETQIQSMNLTNNSVVITYMNKQKKTTQIIFREYQFSGKIIKSTPILGSSNYAFLSAKYFDSSDRRLLVGNYGIGKSNNDDYQNSQGIYVADLENIKNIKYYSFDKFQNFFGFLNERQKEKLEKQVKKKKEKGSEYNFNYRLHINELIPNGDNLLISSEVFVPEFRNNSLNSPFYGGSYFYPASIWGRQYLNSYYWMNSPSMWGYRSRGSSSFDGFRYIEGVVIELNKNGDLVWDNSVQYKNLKYYNLIPHLKVSNAGANTFLSYTNLDKLNIKEFASNGVLVNSETVDKKSQDFLQKNKKAEFENYEHWFDNYFFNWGVVKNSGSNFKQTCFIQKIAQ
ncbi:hypothetical protein EGI22_12390 [Lacihabitans sp. LS3-19]|uniref:hypothetical protein n=1 Tax=Lacihabitans sp. LS3-19 TaxID=2487335 RepID=UPI0020CF29A4|nr:hypothetical protein [Lacihabitans sp. LS3-19]MCP9768716.1 hypothetical protein [Lacihabitans sp. LS3-19]